MSVSKLMFAAALLMVAVLAVGLLSGCPSKSDETVLAPVDPAPPIGEEAGAATDAPAATGAPSDFTWTDAPQLEMIPAGPVKGMVNGAPFEAKTVRVEKDTDGYTLEISNATEEKPGDIISDDIAVELSFKGNEGEPTTVLKAVGDDIEGAHAYYHYPMEDGTPMSMNPLWACALQITEWKLEKDADNERVIGHVKGKVVITFDDASLNDNVNDETKSWVAGEFDTYYYEW